MTKMTANSIDSLTSANVTATEIVDGTLAVTILDSIDRYCPQLHVGLSANLQT